MKKGMAINGYILDDGTVKPLGEYDDTELREEIQKLKDEIDNIKSRISRCPCAGDGSDEYLYLSKIATSDVDSDGFIVVENIPVDEDGYIKIAETGVTSDGYITA